MRREAGRVLCTNLNCVLYPEDVFGPRSKEERADFELAQAGPRRLAARKLVHWRKTLKSGAVQFHFQAGTEKMKGTVAPAAIVDDLQQKFEQVHGVKLPAPEWRGVSV
jgi:hypothetical protein